MKTRPVRNIRLSRICAGQMFHIVVNKFYFF